MVAAVTTATGPSPSQQRRRALKEADADVGSNNGIPLVSNFFPIDRYYNAAEKLYEAFGQAYQERRLDDAYVYGLRFAAFSVEGLPKHDYYKSVKYEVQRKRNTILVKEVLTKVEAVVRFMDEEELAKQQFLQRRQEEISRREEEKERLRYDALQERINKLKEDKRKTTTSTEQVESSALSKLELLRHPQGTKPNTTSAAVDHERRHHDDRRHDHHNGRGSSHRTSSRRGTRTDDAALRRSHSGSSDDNHTASSGGSGAAAATASSRDSRRRRNTGQANNNSFDSYDDDNNDKQQQHLRRNGHRSDGRRSSSGSSDDDTGSNNNPNNARRVNNNRPPTSAYSRPNNASERGLPSRNASTHSTNSSSSTNTSRRHRSKSPSILIEDGAHTSHNNNNNNSWSQASDPKDAWKLETDDSEPVSSRFQENFPTNRHGPNGGTTGTTTSNTPSTLPKSSVLPPPILPPPPSYNQVVSNLKTDTLSTPSAPNAASMVNSRFRANQYFGPGNSGPDFTMNNAVNRPFAAPAGGAKRWNSQVESNQAILSSQRRSSGELLLPPPQQQQQQQPVVVSRPVKPAERIPIRKLRDAYANDYRRALQEGWIEIRPIDTYQGRLRQSTNGCTVISPLVVAHHLRNSAGGVLDSEIVDVIDKECGPLLREIRNKLGLEGDSLIIPSDVHDHLVDRKILQQDKFHGATGGNIMDRDHVWEFLKLLQADDKGAYVKAGACLFFHEHVVSLVKMPIGRGKVVYDLIDSMPNSNYGGGRATRTRCRDIAALEILLRWYASRKFSESECTYMDRNEWDENMADFDPRVFQSFVWTE